MLGVGSRNQGFVTGDIFYDKFYVTTHQTLHNIGNEIIRIGSQLGYLHPWSVISYHAIICEDFSSILLWVYGGYKDGNNYESTGCVSTDFVHWYLSLQPQKILFFEKTNT